MPMRVRVSKSLGKGARLVGSYSLGAWILSKLIFEPIELMIKLMLFPFVLPFKLLGSLFRRR